jgi:hypothetical protein
MVSALVLGAVTAAGVPAAPVPAVAAHVRYQYTADWYGPCCAHRVIATGNSD